MRNLFIVFLLGLFSSIAAAQTGSPSPLRLEKMIPMNGVEGRIDHFAVDVKGQRLFMCALGNNTLEVFDLREGKRIKTVSGLHEPQGVAYVPEMGRIYVANGETGALNIYDGTSFKLLQEVKFSEDADNVRYDASAKQIYVGYGAGALGIVDAASGKFVGDIKLEAHPESFQMEKNGHRIFVNVPDAGIIAVIDRQKREVIAKWPLGGHHANFPMALDEENHRLFVACRKPAELWVFDTGSGNVISKEPCAGDADDLFYDASHKLIYVSGGEGTISALEQVDANHYRSAAMIRTAPGARTSFFVPELNRLYLAVPHRGAQKAELRVYEVNR